MKYKVVIIDDEPWTREVIKSLADWEAYDMNVMGEASDGFSGLELVLHIKPDIIITDVKMPGMDGLELLAALRKENCTAKTIVISGYDDFSYIKNAIKLQVTDYLLKPIKSDELNELLARCKEMLQAEQRAGSGMNYDASAFMAVEWIKEYLKMREQLYSCLCAQNRDMIKDYFSKLQNFILKKECDDISIKLMINIYYDLMRTLERFIISNGYTIADIFGENNISYVFHQDASLQSLIGFCSKLHIEASDGIGILKKIRNRVNIKQIKDYIDANYMNSITLEQIAELFFLSKEYLSKLFKQYTGKSFSDYITDIRMQKARSLICEYKVPIKEVFTLVGYSDQTHFYKMFKKHFGMTPGEIQRTIL